MRTRRIVSCMTAILTLCVFTLSTLGQKNTSPELEELGVTLRAAVASRAMSEGEAKRVYIYYERQLAAQAAGGVWVDPESQAEDRKRSEYRDISMAVPSSRVIRALYQPEFLTRDLSLLRDELELDEEQLMIAKVLFDDYEMGIELATSPLREAMYLYKTTSERRWMTEVLDRAKVPDVAVATRRVQREINGWNKGIERAGEEISEEKRQAIQRYGQRMLDATAELEDRINDIRSRLVVQFGSDDSKSEVTAADLLRMANWLRSERSELHDAMINSLRLIMTEEQLGEEEEEFNAAMARLSVERQLPLGRMGGETINLWATTNQIDRVVAHSTGVDAPLFRTKQELDAQTSTIAERLDERTQVSIDREITGLEVLNVRARISEENGGSRTSLRTERQQEQLDAARDRFAQAARQEVEASINARDQIMSLLEQTTLSMELLYPDSGFAGMYRKEALQRGFAREMTKQWSERALTVAIAMEEIDQETRALIEGLHTDNDQQLHMLREDAVTQRLQRDPKLAMDQIEARYSQNSEKKDVLEPYGESLWYGVNYKQYQQLDDQTEIALMALLTAEQFASLPPRKEIYDKKDGDAKGGKGGKGKNDSGGKGKGGGGKG